MLPQPYRCSGVESVFDTVDIDKDYFGKDCSDIDCSDRDCSDKNYPGMNSGYFAMLRSDPDYIVDCYYWTDIEVAPAAAADIRADRSTFDSDQNDSSDCYSRSDYYNLPWLFPFA